VRRARVGAAAGRMARWTSNAGDRSRSRSSWSWGSVRRRVT